MKQIIINTIYANLFLKKAERSPDYDSADVAFLCAIEKINETKGRRV